MNKLKFYLEFLRSRMMNPQDLPDYILAGVFLLMGTLLMLGQWALIIEGVQEISQFRVDARKVWLPHAQDVLAGEPMYGPDQFDNKPPLFHLVNLVIASVGPYYLLFYALIGVFHGSSAYLLFLWSRRHGVARIGAVASVLFLGAIHAGFMARIDPRPFAGVLILVALLSSRSIVAGASLAAATTLIQFAVFALPVVVWKHIRDLDRTGKSIWTAKFALSGILVATLVFGTIGAIWGKMALEYAIRYTVLGTGHYTMTHSIWIVPISVIGGHGIWTTEMYYIVFPAILGVLRFLTGPNHEITPDDATVPQYRSDREIGIRTWLMNLDWRSPRGEALLLTSTLMVPFLIRSHGMYWYVPLPFMAILAAFGFHDYFSADV